jgi:hypothetical protein
MTPLEVAAEITGLTQQAIEKLHGLRTYQLTSATTLRHEKMLDEVYWGLVGARNAMATLTLLFGKEHV